MALTRALGLSDVHEASRTSEGINASARRLFAATGDDRSLVADPHARYYATEPHDGELPLGAGALIGTVDFDKRLPANQDDGR